MSTKTPLRPLAVRYPEAAELLGVTRQYVYRLVDEGKLRRVKVGNASRIAMSSIDALIAGVTEDDLIS